MDGNVGSIRVDYGVFMFTNCPAAEMDTFSVVFLALQLRTCGFS